MRYGKGYEKKTVRHTFRLTIIEDMLIKAYANTYCTSYVQAAREIFFAGIKSNDQMNFFYENITERIENGTFFDEEEDDYDENY